jgi:hypothetical protein
MVSFSPMNSDNLPPAEKKRHESFRTFGGFKNFAEADDEVRAYWWSRTPAERMEALEDLRIAVYGEEAINAKVARVYGPIETRRN